MTDKKKTAPGETGAGNAEDRLRWLVNADFDNENVFDFFIDYQEHHASADSMYRRSANYELKLCLERTKRGAAKRMAELAGGDSNFRQYAMK